MRRLAGALALLFGLLLVLLVVSPGGRIAWKTLFIIPEVLDLPVRPLAWASAPPEEERLTFGQPRRAATVYRPAQEGPHGAVILTLGAFPDPEDPTLHALARALARAGAVAMIPVSPSMLAGDVSIEHADELVQAFEFLRQQPYVEAERIGFAGFCVGASFAALAAEDPRINEDVAFVNWFGGYLDARDLLHASSSESILVDGAWQDWKPDPRTTEIIRRQLIAGLPAGQERDALARLLLADGVGSASALPSLSSESTNVLRLALRPTPEQAETLIDRLSESTTQRLRELSPLTNLDRLKAKVLIMHDTGDDLIPFVESRRLAERLPPGQASYSEFSMFEHVHPEGLRFTPGFLWDLALLYRHMYGVLGLFL